MRPYIELTTERLRLRQWRDSDLEPFAALNADPRVMEHFPATLTRAESDAVVERFATLIGKRGWGFWAAELSATGTCIGFIGLHAQPAEFPVGPCIEIGWRLAQDQWGKGLASEGARAALQTGFRTLGFDEIVSFTATTNLRSAAVMQRLGMHPDGTFEHPLLPRGHGLRTHLLYRLRRDQFEADNPQGRSA